MSQARSHDYGGPVSDHLNGVVFYRLRLDQVSQEQVRTAVTGIAEFMGSQLLGQPFVVRVALRDNHDGTFWVGLNSTTAGELFQQVLTGLRAKVSRAYRLPGSNPNPPLGAVLGEPVGDYEPSAPLPQPSGRRERRQEPVDNPTTPPPEQHQGLGLTDKSRAARAELGKFDLAGTLRKVNAFRKGGWRDIGKRSRGDDGE